MSSLISNLLSVVCMFGFPAFRVNPRCLALSFGSLNFRGHVKPRSQAFGIQFRFWTLIRGICRPSSLVPGAAPGCGITSSRTEHTAILDRRKPHQTCRTLSGHQASGPTLTSLTAWSLSTCLRRGGGMRSCGGADEGASSRDFPNGSRHLGVLGIRLSS